MKLFFREEGNEGKAVVIIHGLYGSSDNWLTAGKKLGIRHHVYLVDQRNHGHSPNSREHTYEAMKEDMAEFFEQHHLEKAIVIGHSMGGKTAMAFAADYPKFVEKLVIVDIAPKDYLLSGEESQYFQHRHILEVLSEVEQNSGQFGSREAISNFLELKLDGRDLVRFLLKSFYRNKESRHFRCRINIEALNDSLEEIISGVNEDFFADRLPILNYPVLFIKGQNSAYIQEEDFGLIKKIYPESAIRIIPEAGHWLHAEQPALFMEALERFIG